MNDSRGPDACSADIRSYLDSSDGCNVPVPDDCGRPARAVGRNDHLVQHFGGDSGEERSVKEPAYAIPELPVLDLNGENSLESIDDSSGSSDSFRNTLDDSNSAESAVSDMSGFSEMSGRDWKPHAGPMAWIHRQMCQNVDPRSILAQLLPRNSSIPNDIDEICLWKLVIDILTEPPRRRRLRHVNTLEDVRRLIRCSSKIMIITGAGVSVSCGIPDFRSKDGLYARLAVDFPSLPDPQAMFDINYFKKDPRPFFKFAKEIYPGQFQPSPAHRFIKLVESHGKLLRNYSQNIDTLENLAGIENVIHCHGSFASATCMKCQLKFGSEAIRSDIFEQKIPLCPKCCPSGELNIDFDAPVAEEESEEDLSLFARPEGTIDSELSNQQTPKPEKDTLPIIKPDIVFFGEGLPEEFHSSMAKDKDSCDLVIVIGSSLKVRPVALIPSSVPHSVPLILINREPLNHITFDVQLLGDCDVICNELCRRLGDDWTGPGLDKPAMTELTTLPSRASSRAGEDSVGSFSGRNGGGDDDEPKSEHDLEALRRCWQPKLRESVAHRLPEGCFLHIPPNRYVFPGAELYVDADEYDEDESGENDTDSECSDLVSSPSTPSSPASLLDSDSPSKATSDENSIETDLCGGEEVSNIASEENSDEPDLNGEEVMLFPRAYNVRPPPDFDDDAASSLPSPKVPRLE